MTAAHCTTGDGNDFYSGGNLYGESNGWNHGNGYDYTWLHSNGQNYASTIHTTPGDPATRPVRGKVTTKNGDFACFGGSVSLADCGAQVYLVNAREFCSNRDCTEGQWARRIATQGWICEPGDSGGVVYQRSGGNALAAGMITATVLDAYGDPGQVYGHYVCFFQTVAHIEAGSGLSVVTVK